MIFVDGASGSRRWRILSVDARLDPAVLKPELENEFCGLGMQPHAIAGHVLPEMLHFRGQRRMKKHGAADADRERHWNFVAFFVDVRTRAVFLNKSLFMNGTALNDGDLEPSIAVLRV